MSISAPRTVRFTSRTLATWLTVAVVSLLAAIATPGAIYSQEVIEFTDVQDFDTPESWALKYFSSLSAFHSLRSISKSEGGFTLGAEVMQAPHLDLEQRTVGFGGRKEEALNRAPVWARLRATLGLPGGLDLEVGWVPPVELDGIEANIIGVALQGPLAGGDSWNLGWRLYGQQGDADADFTCSAEDAAFPPGSPQNAFGCEAQSADTVTLDNYGAELVASWALGRSGTRLFLSGAYQENDLEFQVNAQTFGFIDRTRIVTDGSTTAFGAGLEWNWREGSVATIGVRYTPLDIVRLGETAAASEDLLHFRALVTYRLF